MMGTKLFLKFSRFRLALLGALLLLPMLGMATTYRLDDSASPRSRVAPQMTLSDEGRPLAESLAPRSATVRYGRIEYRLATASFVGRQARIYLVVPTNIPGLRAPAGLQLVWQGSGRFTSGAARPGERRLVWSGVVPGAWMQESLDLTLELNLAYFQLPANNTVGFESYFEIEVTP